MPHPLRLLINLLSLKSDKSHKDFMTNLSIFNSKIAKMISNASRGIVFEDKKEEIVNYALICFLRVPELEISLENFKMIVHLYFISICNGFGIADDQMLRIGTGLYYPSVSS